MSWYVSLAVGLALGVVVSIVLGATLAVAAESVEPPVRRR